MITPEIARKALEALDALPNKRLASGSFYRAGDYCLTGAIVAKAFPSLDKGDMRGNSWVDHAEDLGLDATDRIDLYHLNDGADVDGLIRKLDESPEDRYTRVYASLKEVVS